MTNYSFSDWSIPASFIGSGRALKSYKPPFFYLPINASGNDTYFRSKFLISKDDVKRHKKLSSFYTIKFSKILWSREQLENTENALSLWQVLPLFFPISHQGYFGLPAYGLKFTNYYCTHYWCMNCLLIIYLSDTAVDQVWGIGSMVMGWGRLFTTASVRYCQSNFDLSQDILSK